MAANDDDAAEPVSAKQLATPSAGLVGLDAIATETVTLFLEILGWFVATASAIQDLPESPYRLVFIDAHLFMASPMDTGPRFGGWENIVLVGPPASATFIGIRDAGIFQTDLPLDIAHLETIVAAAS